MAAKATISLDEFLKLPPETTHGVHYELDEGGLIRLPPAGKTHAAIVLRAGSYLDQILPADRFTVLVGEAGIILDSSASTPTVRGADIAVVESVPASDDPSRCRPLDRRALPRADARARRPSSKSRDGWLTARNA